MSKILVLSDTHKNYDILKKVLKMEKNYNTIFHLGDDYEDIESLKTEKEVSLFRVPGIYHPKYLSGVLPKTLIAEIDNISFTLVHSISDCLNPKTNFVLFGHTHNFTFYKKDGVYFLNPGHLKSETDRGHIATYATVTINSSNIKLKIKSLFQDVIQDTSISL